MENDLVILPLMTFEQCQYHLCEDLPNKVFWYVHIAIFALFDQLSQVPTWTVLHDDINSQVLSIYDLVMVPHNIIMLELSEDIDFVYELKLLFLLHLPIVYLLPNHLFT